MSAAVWLHDGPVGSGPGAVRLPSQTVREVLVDGEFKPSQLSDDLWRALHPDARRTRVVSPVVDLPEDGRMFHGVPCPELCHQGDVPWSASCARCGGSGVVVVGYSDTRVLPVVGASDAPPDAPQFIRSHYERAWTTDAMSSFAVDLTDPWAADLVPGDRVLRWESVVMLDQPIVSMRVFAYADAYAPAMDVVPLQLASGWNPSVELEVES